MLGTCLLKYGVLNKMFSFVLMGSCEGTTPHFTLTQHLLSSASTRISAATAPCVCEVWVCFNQRQSWKDLQASNLMAEPKRVSQNP